MQGKDFLKTMMNLCGRDSPGGEFEPILSVPVKARERKHGNEREPRDYSAQCASEFDSPLGKILMAADGAGLTGLWLCGQKHFALGLDKCCERRELPVFDETRRWLRIYFSGREPDFTPPLHLAGTEFQMSVWKTLQGIPYGETTTYGEIARRIARPRGKMQYRAVGSAVGRNPISIIVPCHRVVGANGSLAGYAGGLDRKAALLKLEGANFHQDFFQH